MADWKHLGVRLTPEAWAAWDRLCTLRGVTMTTLAEALGQMLAEGEDWVPESAIERARAIDRERRSRG